jgi:tetratricopeptide (TPR) repeat protein
MRRGLFEALEQILLQKPELLSDEAITTTYSDLVGKCIIAALQVKRGVLPERDMSMAIYGRDVPPATFHKLVTRSQRALEALMFELTPKTAEGTMQSMWTSILHLYTTGITAYYGNKFYLAHERLSTVMSAVRDPYMMPLAVSSGLTLMFLEIRMGRHDKALKAIAATQKTMDTLTETWYWMAMYVELLALGSRRYKDQSSRYREVHSILEDTRLHGLKTIAPQAQMIAALCAYMVYVPLSEPRKVLQWVEIYRKAVQRLGPNVEQYRSAQMHMYLQAYQKLRDDKGSIPVLRQLIEQERSKSNAANNNILTQHLTWLGRSLLAVGRYAEAVEALDQINPQSLKHVEWYVRPTILVQRELATGMLRDISTPFDRRVIRAATVKNVSAVRASQQLRFRIGALCAMLIHCRLRGSVGTYTADMIAEKLQQLLKNHDEVKACARTAAFIRLVGSYEFHEDRASTTRQQRNNVKRLMNVFTEHPTRSLHEFVRYENILAHIYGR